MANTQKKKSPGKAGKKSTTSQAQLKKRILQFVTEASSKVVKNAKGGAQVKHGLGCVLATAKNNLPRATPVDFFSDGLTLWIVGDPGKKVVNIKSNPNVSVGIYHPLRPGELNRSTQIVGKATLVNLKENRRTFLARLKKIGLYTVIEKNARHQAEAEGLSKAEMEQVRLKMLGWFNLIKIEPEEITFLYMHPTKGYDKNIWRKRR